MRFPRELPQHARSLFCIGGLAQDLFSHLDNRVGAKHHILRTTLPHYERLIASQALGTLPRTLTVQWSLIHIRRLYRKRNARVTEKFLTSR